MDAVDKFIYEMQLNKDSWIFVSLGKVIISAMTTSSDTSLVYLNLGLRLPIQLVFEYTI